jgi:hypothetical protein
LNAHNIYRRITAKDAANDIVVEVLVRSERQHESLLLTPPSQETISDPSGVKTRLVLATHLCGDALALAKITFDLGGVTEDKADDFIHLIKLEGGILLHNPLRRHTLAECSDEGVERDTRGADAHHSIGIAGKRGRLGGHHKRHRITSSDSFHCASLPRGNQTGKQTTPDRHAAEKCVNSFSASTFSAPN